MFYDVQYDNVQKCFMRAVVVDFNVLAGILCPLDDVTEDCSPPGPAAVRDDVSRVGNEWSVVCVELARLVRRTSPLPAWAQESRVCWVSCVLSWHVLSEGQVHYQRGHTSLECVECRVC